LSIEDMFKRIGAAAGIAFSLDGAKSFISKVVEMRSYFQDIESSMQVFLGNEEKAAKFMEDLKSAAYYNMFEFTDLANASKQLIAYKNDIDTVIPTIQKLSDIAVGTSANLDELVHLYNKAKSTGRVSTQDLYSWATKGVVLKDVLKDMGEEASNTSVTFEQLNKVLDSLTSDGGMFYQQQEKMMNNISAEIGQFEDNLALMLNEIGEKYQDQITGAIKLGSELIDNYQVIAGWIKDIVIVYGTYRAVLATCLAIDKAVVYWKGLQAEATMMNTLANTGETGSVTALTVAKLRLVTATKALTTAMLANPYVLVAAGVAALTFAVYKLATSETELEKAQEKLDDAYENNMAEMRAEQTEIDRLFGKLKKAKEGTEEYKKVKDQILGQYGKYLTGLNNEIATLKDVEGAYKAVTKAAREASLARGREAALKDVQDTYGSSYSNNMTNLQEALRSRLGSSKAGELIGRVQKELNDFGNITVQLENRIKNALRGTVDYGNSSRWLQNLRNNEKYLNDYTKLVDERFMLDEEEEKHEEEKKVRNKQAIEEEKKNLQAELDNLSKEEAIGQKGAKLKEKIRNLDKELKAYNATDKSGAQTSKDAASRRQKLFEQDMAAEESQSRQKRELHDALRDLEIASEQDNAKRELLQMQKDHEDKLEAIREQADQWKKEAYKAAEERWNATNKDKTKTFADTSEGKAGWQAQSLTSDQEQIIQARVNAENAIYNRGVKERLEVEKQHMLDYLKEYGSISQKKQAIAAEYDKKIAETQDKWLKKSLEQEKKKALNALEQSQLEKSDEYLRFFSALYSMTADEAKNIGEQIRKNLDEALQKGTISAQEYYETIEKIDEQLEKASANQGAFMAFMQGGLSGLSDYYQQTGRDTFRQGSNMIERANSQLAELKERNASGEMNAAQQKAASEARQMGEQMQQAGAAMQETGDSMQTTIMYIDMIINGIDAIVQGFQKISDDLKEINGEEWGLQGKDEARFGAFSRASSSAASGWNSLKNGDFQGAVAGVIGSWTEWFKSDWEGTNANWEKLENRLQRMNNALSSIDSRLQKQIDMSMGSQAQAAGERYIADRQAQIAATQETAEAWLRSHSMNWNHSNWWYIERGKEDTWANINGKRTTWGEVLPELYSGLGLENGGMAGLAHLNSEQLKWVQDNYRELWIKLPDELRQYLESIIEYSEDIEETAEGIKKANIGLDLETLKSDYVDFLTDLDADNEEFSNNFAEYIRRALMSKLVADKYSERIQALIDHSNEIAERAKAEGRDIMADEYDEIERERRGIDEDIKKDKEYYSELYGWASQEATKYFQNLKSTFLDTLMNMEADAEEWANSILRVMTEDLISKLVLGDGFNEWMKDWRERYAEAVKNGDTEAITALRQELTEMREKLKEDARQVMDDVGYTAMLDAEKEKAEAEEIKSIFTDLHSSLLDLLMDSNRDIDDWTKELRKTIVRQLIERTILNEAFDKMLDEWGDRYMSIIKAYEEGGISANARDAALDSLLGDVNAYAEKAGNAANAFLERFGLVAVNGFSDLNGTLLSMLEDTEKSLAEKSRDIARTMMQQMVENILKSKYQQQIDELNQQWADALANGDTEQIEAIREAIMRLYDTIADDSAIKELLRGLKETETPFDNMRDSFRSALMDMEKDTKDFTKDISQMIAESFVDAFVMGDAFDDKLEIWKKRYKEITDDTGLSEEERMRQLKALSELIASERDLMKDEVSDILKWLGISDREDQKATANMAESATYDQFELYLGMATSHLMVAEQTKDITAQILSTLQSMSSITQPGTNYGEQIFMRLGTTNEYLLAVKLATEGIREEFGQKLDAMNSHLQKL